jgi:hypothetical protein
MKKRRSFHAAYFFNGIVYVFAGLSRLNAEKYSEKTWILMTDSLPASFSGSYSYTVECLQEKMFIASFDNNQMCMFDPALENFSLLNFELPETREHKRICTNGVNFFIICPQDMYEISFVGSLLNHYPNETENVWHHCNPVSYNGKAYFLNA